MVSKRRSGKESRARQQLKISRQTAEQLRIVRIASLFTVPNNDEDDFGEDTEPIVAPADRVK